MQGEFLMSTATASTTVVHPADPSLRQAVRLASLFALAKLILHICTNLWQAHIGWGYFRDEFYYFACGHHLAWGYVDHGPIVALQARIAETMFGRSLAGIRLLSALGGALRVLLTGLLAWALGGRRPAQALAMIGLLLAPQYLGIDSFLSMNSWESFFWMGCLLALILLLRGKSARGCWIVFGIFAGIGLLNKPSMTFFLVALLMGLLLTPQRRILFSRWSALGIALLVLIALPNLLWQIANHWPTLEFLHNGRIGHKNIALAPLPFLAQQLLNLNPVSVFLWGWGLIWLLFSSLAKRWRFLGITYLAFLVSMMALHAKDYYVIPIYPVLFATGGIAWEQAFRNHPAVRHDRVFAFPVYETLLIFTGLLILPMAIPVLRPASWIAYAKAMHLYNQSGNTENVSSGVLPQFFADRFGWQEEVDAIRTVMQRLSPDERVHAGILVDNYGEAGALDFLGHGLPPVISGHNTYWLWGPHDVGGQVLIVLSGDPTRRFDRFCSRVEDEGRLNHPLSMPYERKHIYLLHGCRRPISPKDDWLRYKHYF
jgi:4-amino-4-deoxy-L-arabinose transferase-like glycosyltransferase